MPQLKITRIDDAGKKPIFFTDITVPGAGRRLSLPANHFVILDYTGEVVTSYATGAIATFVTRGLVHVELTEERVRAATPIRSPSGKAGGGLSGVYPNPVVAGLEIAGQVQGAILYFDGTNWSALTPGSIGHLLTTYGTGANPSWAAPGGTVTGASPNFKEEELSASGFTFALGVSSHALSSTSSSDASAVAYARLFVNGVRDVTYTKVVGVPAAYREWRLNGATLEIFGNVTATGDVFNVEYIALAAIPVYKEERFTAATFTYTGTVSQHALLTAASTDAGAVAYARLFINGVRDVSYTKVTSGPAALKEWRVNGALLEIFGDVTATGNIYDIEYL